MTEEEKKEAIVMIGLRLPESLRMKFKIACIRNGSTMNETIVQLMETYIEEK